VKQRRKAKRFRPVGKLAGAVTLVALLPLPLSSLAQADSSNLLPNGSFQSGTTGWTTSDASLTIASDGADDSFAGRVAHNTTASSYQLAAKPRPVQSTTAGTLYTANGVVRSDTPGKSVCLLLKEFTSGGTLVLVNNLCVTTSSQWAALPQVTLTAQASGDQIAFIVRQSNAAASDSFEVDTLSLVASGGGGGGGSAPSTPTNVIATAVSPSEIDVSWSASTDPDPDGVAGYTIYRDGVTALGPVGGSTTSFADASVAPGSTHFYTVAAFDPEGNTSPQSQPSNSATTPTGQSSVVGLWHLDETSGTTAHDSSGNGNNGSINGTVTLGVPGEFGTAYSFVPKSNVIVPNASDLIPGTANITISYWLKATTKPTTGDYDVFTKGDANTSGGQIKLEVQQNGQASCQFRGSSGAKQLQMGPNVVDGQWHHVICQRVGTQVVETVDGASFSATNATGAITVTAEIRLGSHLGARPLGGGDWYNGVLDEVSYSIG
jgi:hypothetical protein